MAGRPSTTDISNPRIGESDISRSGALSVLFDTAGVLVCLARINPRLKDDFEFCVFVFPETDLGLKRANFVGQC
jgi:hypothetical protein